MITTKKCNKIIAILFFDSKEDDDNGTRIIIRFPHLHPFEIYFDLPKKKNLRRWLQNGQEWEKEIDSQYDDSLFGSRHRLLLCSVIETLVFDNKVRIEIH